VCRESRCVKPLMELVRHAPSSALSESCRSRLLACENYQSGGERSRAASSVPVAASHRPG
jgi:hypothetical protein